MKILKLLMIGTSTCSKCKSMLPRVEEYCKINNIEFRYALTSELTAEELSILNSKRIMQAPAYVIYKEEDIVVVSGDNIFLELESL